MGTPLTDSCSDGRCFSEDFAPVFPGFLIREVTKLDDFLPQRVGSKHKLAEVVNTQWTWLGTHTQTHTHSERTSTHCGELVWFTCAESRSWKVFNKYNEWRHCGDYEPISKADLSQTHRFIGTNIHRLAHIHTNTHIYTSINRQLIYKWADLCVGLALR